MNWITISKIHGQLPWVEFALSFNSKVVQVQCKVCIWIQSRNKLLVPKFDYLLKHASHHKVLVFMPRVLFYKKTFMKNNIHVANEKFYFAKGLETILQQIIHVQLKLIGRKNLSKLPLIFHLFNHGHPMIEYITQNLFVQLNVFNNPMKH